MRVRLHNRRAARTDGCRPVGATSGQVRSEREEKGSAKRATAAGPSAGWGQGRRHARITEEVVVWVKVVLGW